jgi:hypothetical protein
MFCTDCDNSTSATAKFCHACESKGMAVQDAHPFSALAIGRASLAIRSYGQPRTLRTCLAVALCVISYPVFGQQPGAVEGFTGFVISGEASYQRKQDQAEFEIAEAKSPTGLVRMPFERALGPSEPTTVSHFWAHSMLERGVVSMRVVRPNDTTSRLPTNRGETAVFCAVKMTYRASDIAGYALNCAAIDEQLRADKDGKVLSEIRIGLTRDTGSAGDLLLKCHRTLKCGH